MKRQPISGYSIFEYWAGKKDFNGVLWIVDPGEKTCFKCGCMDIEIQEGETLKAFWNKRTKLEKAHIIPHALGGTEEPHNIIFLCSKCHKECPDTIDYEANLKWITDHRNLPGHDNALSILSTLSKDELESVLKLSFSELSEQMLKRMGTHGFTFSDSSVELAFKQLVQELTNRKG